MFDLSAREHHKSSRKTKSVDTAFFLSSGDSPPPSHKNNAPPQKNDRAGLPGAGLFDSPPTLAVFPPGTTVASSSSLAAAPPPPPHAMGGGDARTTSSTTSSGDFGGFGASTNNFGGHFGTQVNPFSGGVSRADASAGISQADLELHNAHVARALAAASRASHSPQISTHRHHKDSSSSLFSDGAADLVNYDGPGAHHPYGGGGHVSNNNYYYGQQQQQFTNNNQGHPGAFFLSTSSPFAADEQRLQQPTTSASHGDFYAPRDLVAAREDLAVVPGADSDDEGGREVVDEQKRSREKAHTLSELVSTEATYREQLSCFVELLQRPLKAFCEACALGETPRHVVTSQPDDARALHMALAPLPAETLLEISRELVASLSPRSSHFDASVTRVGDVFERAAGKIRDAMCSWYDWHERADAELRRLAHRSPELKAFVDRAANDARCGDHQVSSLLIAPTQRLGRQMLFLDRLDKTTPANHPDKPSIRAAYALWRETLDACNALAGNRAMQRRAEAVTRVLDGAPEHVSLAAPGRFLAHEGSLVKIGDVTVRPDYFFLFETKVATELLHVTAPDATSGRFAFKRFSRVLHVEDVELASGTDANADAVAGTVKRGSLINATGVLPSGGPDDASSSSGGGGFNTNASSGTYAAAVSRSLLDYASSSSSSKVEGGSGPAADGRSGSFDPLLLRVVATDPLDKKRGHIYSLAGERKDIVEWKAKITAALGKRAAEWKLRFKGDVVVLAEGAYPCTEAKAANALAFMWFFSGKLGGLVVRAKATARSGKLEWHESLRVDKVDAAPVPLHTVKGDRLKRKIFEHRDTVFRIHCVEKTLVCASDEKDLIVELMKRTSA